ncbi:hypothetical protein EWM64_g4751 [Hericium alpestre]|uniref:Uncharacterized protein n=1 Tax=Hericium alpestre TaxID=135208 RepID=A0A4Y9ZWS2_9AGAM|nr:hypothetical protein EWM64_g4751 [Hericium alpestre]
MSYPRMSLARILVFGPIVKAFAAEFNGDGLRLPFFEYLRIREFDFAKRPAVLDNIMLGIGRRADTFVKTHEASGDPNALELQGCGFNDDQLVRLSEVPNDLE